MLDLAKIEAGRMTLSPEPVHVERLADEVLSLMQPLAAQRKIELQSRTTEHCGHHIFADQQRLEQVPFEREAPRIAPPEVNAVTGGQLILYIEDNPSNLHVVERVFSRLPNR